MRLRPAQGFPGWRPHAPLLYCGEAISAPCDRSRASREGFTYLLLVLHAVDGRLPRAAAAAAIAVESVPLSESRRSHHAPPPSPRRPPRAPPTPTESATGTNRVGWVADRRVRRPTPPHRDAGPGSRST